MNTSQQSVKKADRAACFQLRVGGHLGEQWADWFSGMRITPLDSGDTLLTGMVDDQAALYGLLRQVRDLGLALHSLNEVAADGAASNGEMNCENESDCQ